MATRVFHPCQFNFGDDDIRVVGATVSGGTSLSGIEDTTETTGGGFWRADFSGADFGDRTEQGRRETLSWRALNGGMIGGSVPVIVQFCDRWHQPVGDAARVPHSDGTPFSDDSLYVGSGASATIAAVVNGQTGGNRCTVLDIRFAGQKPLIGGERFSYIGADGWGDRAAEIYSIEDRGGGVTRVTFQPPIRGGVAAGDMLDFDNIRCRMRRTSEASNALSQGIFGSGSLSFVEDMRPPVVPE